MGKVRSSAGVRVDLRVVIYRHREWWIAHCLELDLVAEGTTPTNAFRDLVDISVSQVETATEMGNLESIFRAAPPEIWAMFSRASDAPQLKKKSSSRSIERFEVREAALA
jgi:hypothetical protein